MRKQYLYISTNAPFEPRLDQVIYLEGRHDASVSKALADNYGQICKWMEHCELQFCFFPAMCKLYMDKECREYYAPINLYIDNNLLSSQIQSVNDSLLRYVLKSNKDKLPPSLIRFDRQVDLATGKCYRFIQVVIDGCSTEKDILEKIESAFPLPPKKPANGRVFYSSAPLADIDRGEGDEYADNHFTQEMNTLMWEVRSKIDKLRQLGVGEMVIRELLRPIHAPSRLKVTADKRILLPDYRNREIKMTPLVKAVYILFLKHPEGIVFKHLPEYRQELTDIYMSIVGDNADKEKVRKSIDDVTNPCSNSINEKCSRIREAFLKELNEPFAQFYFIVGERGEAKRVNSFNYHVRIEFV